MTPASSSESPNWMARFDTAWATLSTWHLEFWMWERISHNIRSHLAFSTRCKALPASSHHRWTSGSGSPHGPWRNRCIKVRSQYKVKCANSTIFLKSILTFKTAEHFRPIWYLSMRVLLSAVSPEKAQAMWESISTIFSAGEKWPWAKMINIIWRKDETMGD